jgi:hypothetical protein
MLARVVLPFRHMALQLAEKQKMHGESEENIPQRLEPHSLCEVYGTAKAVPLSKPSLFPQPV